MTGNIFRLQGRNDWLFSPKESVKKAIQCSGGAHFNWKLPGGQLVDEKYLQGFLHSLVLSQLYHPIAGKTEIASPWLPEVPASRTKHQLFAPIRKTSFFDPGSQVSGCDLKTQKF